jgi:hemerythrin-like metal-binding protein
LDLLKTLSYAVLHFRIEEIFMRICDYPDTDAHMTEHAKFVRRLKDCLYQSYGTHGCQARDLIDIMKTWMMDHGWKLDMMYADHVTERKTQTEHGLEVGNKGKGSYS